MNIDRLRAVGRQSFSRFLSGSIVAATLLAWSGFSQAQGASTLRIIVGFTRGGPADLWSRLVSDPLAQDLKQIVVVENKPGASGNIAAQMVARAKPNEKVLFMSGPPQHGSGAAANPALPFDPERDFTMVATLAETASVLAVRADSRHKTLRSLVDDAMSRPGKLTFGSPGAGTSPHLVFELLKLKTGVDIVHAPYRGAGSAMSDLLGGHIDFVIVPFPAVSSQIQSGHLRALAVLGTDKLEALPQVPTAAQAGFPGVQIRVWGGLVGPPGMPADEVNRLNTAINGILRRPATKERLLAVGSTPFITTPAEFAAFVRDDLTLWRKVVRDASITIGPRQ